MKTPDGQEQLEKKELCTDLYVKLWLEIHTKNGRGLITLVDSLKVISCLIPKPYKINMIIFHPIKHDTFLRIPNALLPVLYVKVKGI